MINAEEQIDLFLSKYTLDISDFLETLSEGLRSSGIPIFDDKQYDCSIELVELIMEFSDLKKLYHQTMKP